MLRQRGLLTSARFVRRRLVSRSYSTGNSASKASDPLRILFCGSDDFSCASLKALHNEQARNASLIRSIDVVVRPPKPTGRGGKLLRTVPLQSMADELQLPVYERDTFTGWQMPTQGGEPINLIIAVSFGLFVPPRLIHAAKYGGLNVHFSLLPDLRGSAPIHRALLAGDSHIGVTVQTLDEKNFDAGTVLAQTPAPGIPIPPESTPLQLREILAPIGAEMLVQAIRDGLHVPPVTDAGWRSKATTLPAPREAPKLTPRDRQVDWAYPGWSAATFQLRSRVLGHPWTRALHIGGAVRRVILEGAEKVEPPEEVAVFMRRLRRRLESRAQKTSQDDTNEQLSATQQEATPVSQAAEEAQAEVDDIQSDVKTVTWIQELDDNENMPDHQKNCREIRLPYFPAGDAVLIPAIGGGCVRIASIKLEGEKSKPASRAIKDLTDNRNIHKRDLTDSIADSIMLPVASFSLFDWL